MSDHDEGPPPISQEQIDFAVAHDERLRAVIAMQDMKGWLQDGAPLRPVMQRLFEDAQAAMAEFAGANLGDIRTIQDLQARVFRYQVASETFAMLIARGDAAETSIRNEAPRSGMEDE